MPAQHRILSLVYNDFEAPNLFGPLGAIIPHSPQGIETSIKNGIAVIPTLSLAEALREDHQFDTLFIPGGFGMLPLIWDPILLQRIGKLVDRAANILTVCTGSILLAATGRLDGRKATTNKRLYDELTPKFPGVQWQKRARWVQDGKFLTSSGVTAGIDAGLVFMASTYEAQKASAQGEEASIPGFSREKALHHAHFVAFGLEYRWDSLLKMSHKSALIPLNESSTWDNAVRY
ncbi:hypothetical protein KXW98_005747 [Aspergillus fumigatus]|uniref:ThiJ/PfpI family transcriptional regulator, putative n=1 Tax=Aspergillus fumigatus (strain CBS 144.89 / FGSC A1163 / CEA10) TaxID=451804 RepID=B0Y0E5_ASPFC|nr:ThiJ/PfpI family transcriptional regulator, putative [Aspergillus fumigatus A1163]KAF4254366.1 hypothetical protein CNMCM8714_005153 [Aspergillus fumigatus]KMK58617.1 ThiJ/PfpI family transcriptional regulator, putative [Aspergillus fumigatus Z5]KAF4271693.1 hypothetical protein CNMCM8812_000346 [Aspergillus fumigatus]KAF4288120.1 hypothetical protein CNMCM8689_006401 [Aspergillus fumigatus]